MRRLSSGRALGIAMLLLALAACTGADANDEAEQAVLQQKADFWEIDQIEKRFHEATTKKDIDLMLSLWAPNATLSIGPGVTASGTEQIREFWLEKSDAFKPDNLWISDHPAYKVEITVNGDRGTLHFECHYVDSETAEVHLTTVADADVARIGGEWLITNLVAGSTGLTP